LKKKFTKIQQEWLNKMRETGKPLVKRRSQSGPPRYSVGAEKVSKNTAESLIPILEGGGLESEAMGHVAVRRYTLPESLQNRAETDPKSA
jgi:hypothetical protein